VLQAGGPPALHNFRHLPTRISTQASEPLNELWQSEHGSQLWHYLRNVCNCEGRVLVTTFLAEAQKFKRFVCAADISPEDVFWCCINRTLRNWKAFACDLFEGTTLQIRSFQYRSQQTGVVFALPRLLPNPINLLRCRFRHTFNCKPFLWLNWCNLQWYPKTVLPSSWNWISPRLRVTALFEVILICAKYSFAQHFHPACCRCFAEVGH